MTYASISVARASAGYLKIYVTNCSGAEVDDLREHQRAILRFAHNSVAVCFLKGVR